MSNLDSEYFFMPEDRERYAIDKNLKDGPYIFIQWIFHYKITDLFFVRVVRPNYQTGYEPAID